MADFLDIYFCNVQPTDTDSTSEHALQFSILSWTLLSKRPAFLDCMRSVTGLTRHFVYNAVFSSFSKECSLISASLKRLNWLLAIRFSLETMHSYCCNRLKFRLLNNRLPQGSHALGHVAFKQPSIVARQH